MSAQDSTRKETKTMSRWTRAAFAVLPLVALAAMAFGILRYSDRFSLIEVPDVEELSIQRTTLKPNEIRLDVVNGGPDPITIAQVMVDDAYWKFDMIPADGRLASRGHGEVTIWYPWVEGETHEIVLVSRNGVTFPTTIEVALESPSPSWKSFRYFALLGVLIGVIPVGLGLLMYPVVRDLSDRWLRFLLAFTVGLLLFLGLDTVKEGLELAEDLPGFYQGTELVFGVGLLIFFLLVGLGQTRLSRSGAASSGIMLAFMIALGIGLHNMGEGLAVGSAYVMGKVGVGTALVLGFTLHNITEGLAIVVPLTKKSGALKYLLGFGALAGIPTIAGTLIGGFTYSTFWALIFFSVAAGAIFQVVYIIARSSAIRSSSGDIILVENFLGLFLGLAVMYGTGLLVVV